MRSVRIGTLVTCALLLLSNRALAHDCIVESETAQQERTDGHLRKARDLFKACSESECPQSVRSDCARSFDEVERATPTIVVIARSNGRDVNDVRVLVDGEVVANKLTGDAIAMDPGTRRLRLETETGALLGEREVVAHAAEKNRIIEFEIVLPATTSAPEREGGHTAGPWIIVSVGAAALVAGGVMLALGETDVAKSRDGCVQDTDGTFTCTPLETPDGQSRSALSSTGNALVQGSIFAFAGGGLALAGGLLWHFLEHPHPRAIAVTPLLSPRTIGLTAALHF